MGTGCGAAEARLVWDQEVAGSNPATPTRLIHTGTSASVPACASPVKLNTNSTET